MSNKINSCEIHDKFNKFQNNINITKTRIINEMK